MCMQWKHTSRHTHAHAHTHCISCLMWNWKDGGTEKGNVVLRWFLFFVRTVTQQDNTVNKLLQAVMTLIIIIFRMFFVCFGRNHAIGRDKTSMCVGVLGDTFSQFCLVLYMEKREETWAALDKKVKGDSREEKDKGCWVWWVNNRR